MKPFEKHDQLTRFTKLRYCRTCLLRVVHRQVANFDRVTGFKTYRWVAVEHTCAARRPRP